MCHISLLCHLVWPHYSNAWVQHCWRPAVAVHCLCHLDLVVALDASWAHHLALRIIRVELKFSLVCRTQAQKDTLLTIYLKGRVTLCMMHYLGKWERLGQGVNALKDHVH